MKRQSVVNAYRDIGPDKDARDRMLKNILLSSEISPAGKDDTMKRNKMKPLVIAAVSGLMVFLMGCAVVALSLQDLKIGNVDYAGAPRDVLSLEGVQDTPAYRANQEGLAFTEAYSPELDEYWVSD